MNNSVIAAIGCAFCLASAQGWAHGNDSTKSKHRAMVETSFGKTGDPRKVDRTIIIDMSDRMRFAPAKIRVKQGETVRFDIRNSGKALHEMVLGTMDELKRHAELMRKFPAMEHDEPYQAHVPAGSRGEVTWEFTKPGVFHYGCLIPGHFEAGMIGRIEVVS